MDKQQQIRFLIGLARESGREFRRNRRKWGASDSMARWYLGRRTAFIMAMRVVDGRMGAKLRNMLRRAA